MWGVEHGPADLRVLFVFEQIGIAHPAQGEEPGFEVRNAIQAPLGVGEVLDQMGFEVTHGLELAAEALDVGSIGSHIFARQQDRAPGQAGFHGIQGGFSFPFLRTGPGGELGVGSVGSEASRADWLREGHRVLVRRTLPYENGAEGLAQIGQEM